MSRRLYPITVLVMVVLSAAGQAQNQPAATAGAASAVYARARQLVVNGNAAAGRLLVDSMLAATSPDSTEYAEGLYWRATLAASTSDAERDYRRIVVEYGFSPRAGDALIQLAQLELAGGDREAAEMHLRRFLIEQPGHGERGRAGYLLARLSFDRNDIARGCAVLSRTRGEVPPDSVELRNQVDYLAPRCDGVDTSGAVAGRSADTVAAAGARGRGGAVRGAGTGRYTIQVRAFQSRDAAEALAKRLNASGAQARVVGTARPPYRVRVGRFGTRAAANAALRQLKAKGHKDAFVTETVDER